MQKFATDEAFRAHLESVRWPDGPICDRCGSINNAIPVEGLDGFWRCRDCGKQFSVTAGTPMHGTHLPLDVWYLGMYLILASSKRISAVKLGEQLGVQYRTAWHLATVSGPCSRRARRHGLKGWWKPTRATSVARWPISQSRRPVPESAGAAPRSRCCSPPLSAGARLVPSRFPPHPVPYLRQPYGTGRARASPSCSPTSCRPTAGSGARCRPSPRHPLG
jgi:transposase-like protein